MSTAEITSTKGEHLYPVMDAFEQKHQPIAGYFNSGKGIDLQNIDSRIAEKVLLRFCGKNRPAALPMHDSFIIHHGMEKEMRKAMNEAFHDQFGVECMIELKYNSIAERQKREGGGPQVCNLTLKEILELQAEAGTYHSLLEIQRRRRTTLG